MQASQELFGPRMERNEDGRLVEGCFIPGVPVESGCLMLPSASKIRSGGLW